MLLKQIFYNIKNNTLQVAWYSGDVEEDYNCFRSGEPAVPEFYATLMELGKKIWNDYMKLREQGIKFELSKQRRNVAIVRMVWSRPAEIKEVAYSVKMGLVYRQSDKIAIPIPLPKVDVLVHYDDKITEENLRSMYCADKQMIQLLEKMKQLGLGYAMGERAQQTLAGMDEEEK
jgi:hypothetical protein